MTPRSPSHSGHPSDTPVPFQWRGQLYVTWARGYKTGGFNTVFEEESERIFDPEKSWNYEIGGKVTLFKNRLLAEGSLFYIDISSQQVKQLLDLQGIKIRNAGHSISKGAELTLKVLPTDATLLHLTYGYTHATFRSYQYSEEIDYSGNFLPFVPATPSVSERSIGLTGIRQSAIDCCYRHSIAAWESATGTKTTG